MDPLSTGHAALAALALPHLPSGSVLAYLDPGTGSLLIQALIAGVLTVPFILRRQITAGIARLRGRPSGGQTPPR